MAERVRSRGASRRTPTRSTTAPAQTNSNGLRRSARRDASGASQRFFAATERLGSGGRVVSVMGEVDIATAQALEQTLRAVAEDRAGEVIIDLSDCSFLDSCGLRALISTRSRFEGSKRRLALIVSNPNELMIFQITQVAELFEIHPSLEAAVGRSGNGADHG